MGQEKKETQLVVFRIGDEEFGVEIVQVREIVRLFEITRMPKAPVYIEGVVNLRGQIIAVIDLAKRLGVSAKPRGQNSRIMIVEMGQNTIGMIVDSVVEVLRLPQENIDHVPELIETGVPEHYIRGVGKLKDRLLVLLDLNAVLTYEEVKNLEGHVEGVENIQNKERGS